MSCKPKGPAPFQFKFTFGSRCVFYTYDEHVYFTLYDKVHEYLFDFVCKNTTPGRTLEMCPCQPSNCSFTGRDFEHTGGSLFLKTPATHASF